MNAAAIALALGQARKEGRGWRCPCPACGGKNLTLADDRDGNLLAKCWNCTDKAAVYAELRRRGLLDGRDRDYRQPTVAPARKDDATSIAERAARALAIWREAQPAADTIVEKYLRTRGIFLDRLPAEARAHIRFHPSCPHPTGAWLPAMVGLVEHVVPRPVAIHRTFLRSDGAGKANIECDKACLGPIGGGAVRLGTACADTWLVIGEGIETTLSVTQASNLSGWAALSANGIRTLNLPRDAARVLIASDNDENGGGQRAAYVAAQRFLAEGRRVRMALPPVGTDFNDILCGNAETRLPRHVV